LATAAVLPQQKTNVENPVNSFLGWNTPLYRILRVCMSLTTPSPLRGSALYVHCLSYILMHLSG